MRIPNTMIATGVVAAAFVAVAAVLATPDSEPSTESVPKLVPVAAVTAKSATLRFERFAMQHDSVVAVLTFCNPTDKPIYYGGYGPGAPAYSVEQSIDGKWQDRSIGWCGVGMQSVELPAYSQVRVTMNDSREQGDDPAFRMGIHYSSGTAWSDAIDFQSADAALLRDDDAGE